MFWKNLSIAKKISAGIGCVVMLLCIMSIFSYYGISNMNHEAKQIIEDGKLNEHFAQIEVGHLNWVNKVTALLNDPEITKLDIQFDDRKCNFGKWLYSEERKRIVQQFPELATLLKKIEQPHRELHESAALINSIYEAADPDLPALLLEKEVDHLRWASAIKSSFINNDKSLNVQTDPTKCALGKWLGEEQAKQIYKTGDEKFKQTWDSMVKNHRELHRSTQQINKALMTSKKDAVNIFQNKTLPQLESTKNDLKKLRVNLETKLAGIKKAHHIFEHQTKSALYQVQSILKEVAQTLTEHSHTTEKLFEQDSTALEKKIIIAGIIAIIVGIFLTLLISKTISNPMAEGVTFMEQIANGDLTLQLDIDQNDEIGVLATSINKMSKALNKIFTNISRGVTTLTSSSTELSNVSDKITKNSKATSEKSNTVAAAAEEMSSNMNSVAAATEQATANIQMIVAGTEQMTATIKEIAENMAKGSTTTSQAVEKAQQVSTKVDELGKAASAINKVTETIADISEQTNLLALNATIEAARAGEAGKGFAVVASEIKVLAQQTAEATKEISEKIAEVQTTTDESVNAIGTIVKVINEINEIVTTVAAAIEEQSATTQEISNNVNQAAQGMQEVNENVNQISAVTGEVTKDISDVNNTAKETNRETLKIDTGITMLSKLAEELETMVKQFKI